MQTLIGCDDEVEQANEERDDDYEEALEILKSFHGQPKRAPMEAALERYKNGCVGIAKVKVVILEFLHGRVRAVDTIRAVRKVLSLFHAHDVRQTDTFGFRYVPLAMLSMPRKFVVSGSIWS